MDEIVDQKGDVLKFAGDAILATWRFSDIGNNAKTMLNKVIKCCFDIQQNCDNYMTEVCHDTWKIDRRFPFPSGKCVSRNP